MSFDGVIGGPGVIGADLIVTVGAQYDQLRVADPAPDIADEVERCLVGPVQVFDHDDRWSCRPPEVLEYAAEQVDVGFVAHLDEVTQQAQRSWRRQWVACADDGLRAEGAMNSLTRLVFPAPASPPIKTSEPSPTWAARSCSSRMVRWRSPLEKHQLKWQ